MGGSTSKSSVQFCLTRSLKIVGRCGSVFLEQTKNRGIFTDLCVLSRRIIATFNYGTVE